MIVLRFLLRFLVVPFAMAVAVFAAEVVVVVAHWNRFVAIVAADPNAGSSLFYAIL